MLQILSFFSLDFTNFLLNPQKIHVSPNTTLHSAITTLHSSNTKLHSGDATLYSLRTELHSANTKLQSFLIGLFLVLSKFDLANIHQIINIKCVICIVKGLHFNLAFINNNKIMIQINIRIRINWLL